MTGWTAVVPFKVLGESKTRLSDQLSASERRALSRRMFAHVTDILKGHPQIASVVILSDRRPEEWDGIWIEDEGHGLNAGLEEARVKLGEGGLMVLHADLPLLETGDIDALVSGAEAQGIAIAPDRHGSGTNALASRPGKRITFRFGPDSFRLHREQAPDSAIVQRKGFAIDLDTPDDLTAAVTAGFRLEL